MSISLRTCAECEPYITADYRRMLEIYQGELVSGMRSGAVAVFPNAKGIFAVEDNKKDCIEKLNKDDCRKMTRIWSVKVLDDKISAGRRASVDLCQRQNVPFNSSMLPGRCGLYC